MRVRTGSLNNLISGNSIFNNAELGIDLGAFGVNPNVHCETGVAANAANAGQNYPVLTNLYVGTATQIRGTFDSATNRAYPPVFFQSCGQHLGFGEGQIFLGQASLSLGAICPSNFTVMLLASVPAGWVVTATATDPANNTSEFSAWIPVMMVPQVIGRRQPGQPPDFPVVDQQRRELCFAADIQPRLAATVDGRHQLTLACQRILRAAAVRHQWQRLLPAAGAVMNSAGRQG